MKGQRSVIRALALVSQLSINMLVPVFLSLLIGMKLDALLGTGFLTLIMLLLGIMAALRSMFKTLQPMLKGEREMEDEKYQREFDKRYKGSK